MAWDELRRRCEVRAALLEVPSPFDADVFAERIAERRGRRIVRMPMELDSDHPCGMWIATAEIDLVVHESRTSRSHQDHVFVHELAHMVCDHAPAPLMTEHACALLMPDLDPAVVQGMLERAQYSTEQEQEAELLASVILAKGMAWPSSRSRAVAPEESAIIDRVEYSLRGEGSHVVDPHMVDSDRT